MTPLFKVGSRPEHGYDPRTGKLNFVSGTPTPDWVAEAGTPGYVPPPDSGVRSIHPDFWAGQTVNGRPTMGKPTPERMKPAPVQEISLPEWAISKLPTGASRDAARIVAHGLARTGNTVLKALDTVNRVFGNTGSLLQDIYEKSEANLERDAYEDQGGVPRFLETAVHLASAGGSLGKLLPAAFGVNVGADTYEAAKRAGESDASAIAKGLAHGAVDTAIWTIGHRLAAEHLPEAWRWLGLQIIGATRGATSSVASDVVFNTMGADIDGWEMAGRAAHAAWMVPLLGMLKMGGGKRKEAMELLKKARPDLNLDGERAEVVIETLEREFSDRNSQLTALQWVARKGANLPDDLANIKGAIEAYGRAQDSVKAIPHMRSELEKLTSAPPEADPEKEARRQDRIKRLTRNLESAEGLAEDIKSGPSLMKRSPFEILSNEKYSRFLPRPDPKDVPAFSNMKRYPEGVIGFDVSDDAAGRQATREMINAYMSPSSNPWCLATGKDAAKLGELGPGAEGYWKGHSAVPKQIFFQEVDGKLELTAFRATSSGGEGRQEYWDTSDAGYSGIPLKVKVPGDPMGRYRKMVFRPEAKKTTAPETVRVEDRYGQIREMTRQEAAREASIIEDEIANHEADSEARRRLSALEAALEPPAPSLVEQGSNVVRGTFEDIAPGKVFKGDPFRDGRSQTWVLPRTSRIDGLILDELTRHELPHTIEGLRELRRGWTQPGSSADSGMLDVLDDNIAKMEQSGELSWVLAEDKVRTTENGITKFRTTKYADPTDWDYEPPKPGEQPKPVEIEESELVSPEWMRSRGYDPESEADVRRMQSDLNIQAWGDGREAAMAVVPTKRTYMQTKSGTPETVTYGPNGRDVVSVDFEKDGVPYREEYFHSGPRDTYVPGLLDDREALGIAELPGPSRDYIGINEPNGFRLTRNPGGESPEVLDELKWDDGLGGFVRTSGDKRWRPGTSDRPEDLSFWDTGNGRGELYQEYLDGRVTQDEVRNELNWYIDELDSEFADTRGLDHDLNLLETVPRDKIRGVASIEDWGIVTEERQSDGTWANARSTVIPERAQQRLLAKRAQMIEGTPDDPPDDWLIEDFDMNGEPIPYDRDGTPMFAAKAGRTRRNVRVAARAGDADRFALSRNFLATDEVPETLFGIPVAAGKGSWTGADVRFFREHPEAGGYYDMGDGEGAPEEPPMQAAVGAGDVDDEAEFVLNGNLKTEGRPRYLFRDDEGKVEGYGTQFSTVRQDTDGTWVAIPTIIDGREPLSDDAAFEHYKRTGEFFHRGKTEAEARAGAEAAHNKGAAQNLAWWNNYIADHLNDGTLSEMNKDMQKTVNDPGFLRWAAGQEKGAYERRPGDSDAELRIERRRRAILDGKIEPNAIDLKTLPVKDLNRARKARRSYIDKRRADMGPGGLKADVDGGKAKKKIPPIVKGPLHYGPPPAVAKPDRSGPAPIVRGPLRHGPPPPPSRGKYPGIANNPGNVEKHERRTDKTLFKGEIAGGVRPKRFANFSDPVDGLVAAATVLSRRAAGLAAKGLPFTIENYVPGYAPKSENDVEGYIKNLSRYSGFARDAALDTGNAGDMAKLLKNVVRFESGVPNSEWFTDDEYRRAALAMQEGASDR